MSTPNAFQPTQATLAPVGNGTTSVNTALATKMVGGTVKIVNTNTVTCFVRAGMGAQTATAADFPVNASSTDQLAIGTADNIAIVLSAAGTGIVYLCPGN